MKSRRWVAGKNANEWIQGHYALTIDGRGRVGAYLNIGGGRDNCFSAWSDPGRLQTGDWRQLAMSYDGRRLVVSLDGRQVASAKIDRARQPGSGPFCIGGRPDGYTFLSGHADEIVLYGRSIELEKFRARFLAVKAGKEDRDDPLRKHRIRRWTFDDDKAAQSDLAQAIAEISKTAGLEAAYRKRLLGE